MTDHSSNKQLILDYFDALENSTAEDVSDTIDRFVAGDYHWYGVYPFEEQEDAQGVAEAFWVPFLSAWSPVRRRQDIFIGGTSEVDSSEWVTSMGHFQGLFDNDWLGIPATGKMQKIIYRIFMDSYYPVLMNTNLPCSRTSAKGEKLRSKHSMG